MSGDKIRVDCARFGEILHDIDRPGALDPGLVESALAHAESCSDCARLLTEAESLDLGLRTLVAQEANLQASPRVEKALLREFRDQKAAVARRRFQWQVAVLGAAAATILAIGLVLHQRLAPKGGNNVAQQSPQVAPIVAPRNTQIQQAAQSQASNSEYAADFVSLPYADDPSTLDDGAVVRVNLSRSALAALGMPVADTGDAETIPADLVLGEDGTPEAIRLVSQTTSEQSF